MFIRRGTLYGLTVYSVVSSFTQIRSSTQSRTRHCPPASQPSSLVLSYYMCRAPRRLVQPANALVYALDCITLDTRTDRTRTRNPSASEPAVVAGRLACVVHRDDWCNRRTHGCTHWTVSLWTHVRTIHARGTNPTASEPAVVAGIVSHRHNCPAMG